MSVLTNCTFLDQNRWSECLNNLYFINYKMCNLSYSYRHYTCIPFAKLSFQSQSGENSPGYVFVYIQMYILKLQSNHIHWYETIPLRHWTVCNSFAERGIVYNITDKIEKSGARFQMLLPLNNVFVQHSFVLTPLNSFIASVSLQMFVKYLYNML